MKVQTSSKEWQEGAEFKVRHKQVITGLIMVTASRQLFLLYMCSIFKYYTCNGAFPQLKKQLTMQIYSNLFMWLLP